MTKLPSPVLEAKFQLPSLPALHLSRPRLRDALGKSLAAGSAWVWGPAGFGKTVAVAAWIRRLNTPCAWLSLDDLDTDPSHFAHNLQHAIKLISPGQTMPIEELPENSPEASALVLCRCLATDAPCLQRTVIVIDNVHELSGPSERLLELFLRYKPSWLTLVLISRRRPPSSYIRDTLSDSGCILGPDALRVTEKESMQFLEKAGVSSGSALPQLAALADGWFAALALMATVPESTPERHETVLSKASPSDASLTLPTETVANLRTYAQAAIESALPPFARELYPCCLFLNRFDALLFATAADISEPRTKQALAAFEEAGLIALDSLTGTQQWYRCVSLNALLATTLDLHPLRRQWLARAYDHCEKRGLSNLAAEIAQRNGDWYYLEKSSWRHFSALVKSNDFELIWERLSAIPPDQVRSKSRYAVMSIMAAARRRDFAAMDEALTVALSSLKRTQRDQYYGLASIICATARAVAAERGEARRLIEDVADLLDDVSPYLKGTAEQIVAESYMESDITLMASKLESLFAKGEWRIDEYFGKSLLSTMTLVNAMLGRTEAQQRLDPLLQNYGAGEKTAERSLFMRYHLGKAAFCHQAGEFSGAIDHLSQCENEVMLSGIEIDRSFHLGLRALLAFDVGDRETAATLFFQALNESPLFLAYAFPSLEFLEALFPRNSRLSPQLYRERDGKQPAMLRLRAAAEYFSTGSVVCVDDSLAYAQAIPSSRPLEKFHWLAFAARQIIAESQPPNSLANSLVLQALDLVETYGFTQPFVDDGALLLPALRHTPTTLTEYQRQLIKHIPSRELPTRTFRRLTPREREVASLLDTSLSYQEMADRLNISLGTLRKHTKRIFSKLQAHSRSQAVAQLRYAADLPTYGKEPNG